MKGDFSRKTFRADKHYSAVLMQQGRVQLDADWNEQQAINRHRSETQGYDVVGPSGAPTTSPGFQITPQNRGRTVQISKGHFYVDGILCENVDDVLFTAQRPLGMSLLPKHHGIFLAYLEVWDRHITALEDDQIRETALGGPDTATRTQTVWQVKLLQVDDPGGMVTCDTSLPKWDELLQRNLIGGKDSDIGRLKARSQTITPSPDPLCILPTSAGYRRLENQLYRVEVHHGGTLAKARFKWSRDNGTVVSAIEPEPDKKGVVIRGSEIIVHEMGKDGMLTFASDPLPEWLELTDDRYELLNQRGTLARVKAVDPATRTITFTTDALPSLDAGQHPIVRRWDQRGNDATNEGVAMTGDWQTLEDGVQVLFSEGRYREGDYWLIPARTAIGIEKGHVEWPQKGGIPAPQAPQGTRHHFARLALLRRDTRGFTLVGDCRKLFPPLTAITAADVSFSDATCRLGGATTVQQALDLLCRRKSSICTLMVGPEDDWTSLLKQVPAEGGLVCFRAGNYNLNQPFFFNGTGYLRITGAGPATRIQAPKAEAALVFKGWQQVIVEDLWAEASVAAHTDKQDPKLNGTLMFVECAEVTVERVTASCGAAIRSTVACLSVLNSDPPGKATAGGSVRIRGCELRPGDRQAGIQVINTGRVTVEDNIVQPGGSPAAKTLQELFRDARFRRKYARLLVRNLRVNPKTVDPKRVATIRYQNLVVYMVTDPALAEMWQKLVKFEKPKGIDSEQKLRAYLKKHADEIIGAKGVVETTRPIGEKETWQAFGDWYRRMENELGLQPGSPLTDEIRAKLRRKLADEVRAGAFQPPAAHRTAKVSHAGITLLFDTEPTLVDEWQKLVTLANPQNIKKPQDLSNFFWKLIDRVLKVGIAPAALVELNKWLAGFMANYRVAASQGIVVAGKSQLDVRVINNSVHAAQQGVHLGLHHKKALRSARDVLSRALIVGNTVGVKVTATATGQAHGISVGNVRSLIVENNRVSVTAPESAEVIGIKVFGQLGPMLIISQNHIEKARTGIFVRALAGSSQQSPQWLAADNLAEGADKALDAPQEMRNIYTHS